MHANSNPQVSDTFFDLYRKGINERNSVNLNIKLPNNQLITYLSVTNNENVTNKKFLINEFGSTQKLYSILKKIYNNNTLSLVKCTNSKNEITWIKCDITRHINGNAFLLTFKNDIKENNSINKINKIISTLNLLEENTNLNVASKYLNGFNEEEGFTNFNSFINSLH